MIRVVLPVHLRRLAGTDAEVSLDRSEEHTSELQSHSDLVCRLLPEKKKSIKETAPAFRSVLYIRGNAALSGLSKTLSRRRRPSCTNHDPHETGPASSVLPRTRFHKV